MNMVKDQDGKLLATEEEIRQRWQEHFDNVLNRPEPVAPAVVDDRQPNEIDVSDECITRQEIKQALKNTKNGKATGMNSITTELLKADMEITACVLEDLFRTESEELPVDWICGLIVKLPKKGNLTDWQLAWNNVVICTSESYGNSNYHQTARCSGWDAKRRTGRFQKWAKLN